MKIMLGLSFSGGNWKNAMESLSRFRKAYEPGSDFSIIMGVETLDNLDSILQLSDKPTAEVFKTIEDQNWDAFLFWDGQLNTICKLALADLPKHFNDDFSYSSAVNHMLLLARYAGYDFLVRIDSGTDMPAGRRLRELIETAVEMLDHDRSISDMSGQYDRRLAIRDNNIYCYKNEEYYRFVERMTGINSEMQGTEGALFTSRIPGILTIPFEPLAPPKGLTLVWVSNDGFFQRPPVYGKVNPSIRIPRFDSFGFPKSPSDYFLDVGSMVLLNSLMGGKSPEEAEKELRQFVLELDDRFLCTSLPVNKGKVPLPLDFVSQQFLFKVRDGWENYQKLVSWWEEVINKTLWIAAPSKNYTTSTERHERTTAWNTTVNSCAEVHVRRSA